MMNRNLILNFNYREIADIMIKTSRLIYSIKLLNKSCILDGVSFFLTKKNNKQLKLFQAKLKTGV